MKIMHFESQEARLKYLKGEYEEIIPEEVKETKEKPKKASKKKSEK